MLQNISMLVFERGLYLCAGLIGLYLAFAQPLAIAGEATLSPALTSPPGQENHPAQLPSGAAGMKAHIDPDNKTFKGPRVGKPTVTLPPEHARAFSTSARGLAQRPSSAPGGGVMVHLEGRFMTPLTATLSPAGRLTIQHLPPQTVALPEEE